MFGWIRRFLARARQEAAADRAPDNVLECWMDNQWVRCRAIAAKGLMLLCTGRGIGTAAQTFMVGQTDARDPKAFWEVWRRLSGGALLEWEDGTPYDPSP